MNIDPVSLISGVLQMVSHLPLVGHYASVIIGAAVALSAVVTALIGVWHSIVLLAHALAQVPGLQGLQKLADALKADEDSINSYANGFLLPLLDRLSAVPLPTAPSAQPAPASAAPAAPAAPAPAAPASPSAPAGQ